MNEVTKGCYSVLDVDTINHLKMYRNMKKHHSVILLDGVFSYMKGFTLHN